MINKEACKTCYKERGHSWDEERWNRGYIFCLSIGLIGSIACDPPKSCYHKNNKQELENG